MTDEQAKTTEDLVREANEQAERGRQDDGRPAAEQVDQPADPIEPAPDATPVDTGYVSAEADDEDNIVLGDQ